MAGQRFHGIALANNSTFNNAHFERLAADPLVTAGGRVWFNTVEKVLKFSTLDAGGAVKINIVATAGDLADAITSLQSDLAALETSLDADIAAEVAARTTAISNLTTALNAEVTARTAAVAAETASRISGDADEATARTAAIAVAAATASDELDTETAARLSGDAALGVRIDGVQSELDASQAGAGLNANGTFTAPENTTYLGAVTTLKAADVALDLAISTEVATRVAQVAGLASGLANEAQLRADADITLQAQIEAWTTAQLVGNANADLAEQAARIAKDTALQNELDTTQAAIGLNTDGTMAPITTTNYMNGAATVFAGAFALDTQLKVVTDAVAAEGVARSTADTNFQTALTAEIAARTAGDVAQQTEINTIEAGAGLETDGTYAAPTGSNYLGSAVSLKDADFVLDAATKAVSNRVGVIETTTVPNLQNQITSEVARATAAESAEASTRAAADTANASAITAETARATGVEAGLQDDITAEAVARSSAVSGLASAIANETSRAQTAEGNLNNAISAEATRAAGVEASLQSQVDAVVLASGDGANALKATLNAGRVTYRSGAAALVHTISHNLGTDEYLVNIMVQGVDGVFRNDIVPVEEIDAQNSFRITLTESSNIRVVVMSAKAISSGV